jgi:hypothetical protein
MTPPKKETAAATKPKASTARKTPAKPKAAARAPRKTAKAIRNLRGMTVHARLYGKTPKDPFRIALNPRGQHGDATIVPVELIEDPTFVSGVGVLFEVITQTEFNELAYSQRVGYIERTDAPVIIRPEDTTVATAPDWDGKGRRPQDVAVQRTPQGRQASEREFSTGMHTADVPGSDAALHQMLSAGNEALPDGADIASRRVVVERVRGA